MNAEDFPKNENICKNILKKKVALSILLDKISEILNPKTNEL